jgi:hypothetical protein
MYSSIYLTR